MKRLSILRHAKAAAGNAALSDFDRPLTDEGRDAAARIGAFLKERGIASDYALCSPALRTRQTLDQAGPHLCVSTHASFPERLYNAQPGWILDEINAAAEDCAHLLVIGHNPGVHLLALDLVQPARSDASALARLAGKFPPGALAHLEFEACHWTEIASRRGALAWFVTPKELAR